MLHLSSTGHSPSIICCIFPYKQVTVRMHSINSLLSCTRLFCFSSILVLHCTCIMRVMVGRITLVIWSTTLVIVLPILRSSLHLIIIVPRILSLVRSGGILLPIGSVRVMLGSMLRMLLHLMLGRGGSTSVMSTSTTSCRWLFSYICLSSRSPLLAWFDIITLLHPLLLDGIKAILPVGLFLVILLFFSRELLPCTSYNPCH
mmetsp:Transcript_18441/g.53177  ORF Transcript_18441/g.53177 Transcript_18441/m.53177 type:complete len:202 (+) Transcript_18441:124-729(+)